MSQYYVARTGPRGYHIIISSLSGLCPSDTEEPAVLVAPPHGDLSQALLLCWYVAGC